MTIAAEAIALELKALGASHFFLVTGGDNSLWINLRRHGIQQILARNEASAVYMADAYARLTGRPTYVYGQYGPGAGNVAGALAEPFWSSSPVVAMPTAMRRQHRHRHEYQELEQIHVFAGVTKWQAEAMLPATAPHLARVGALRALGDTPGPVYIGIASDVLEQPVDGYTGPVQPRTLRLPLARPHPEPEAVEDVHRRIAAADRPVLLAGNGVHLSDAEVAFAAMAETLGIPVVTSLAGKGAIAETSDLAFGTVGRYSRRYANDIVSECDLLLAVGTRLGGLVTDSYRLVQPDTTIVHVDTDGAALGANFRVDTAVQADVGAFLEALGAVIDSDGVPANADRRKEWVAELASRRAAWDRTRAQLARNGGGGEGPMRPEAVLQAIDRLAPHDTVVLGDTGYAAAWAGALYATRRPGRGFLRADGSLGWAFPAALGAKLAAPDRAVVCVTGDGGFGYHVGELETARRLGLPVVVVVLNNGALAFEVHVQEQLYDEVVEEVDDFVDVDYAAVARAFGVGGARVATAGEFATAFVDALHHDGTTVIDALVSRDAIGPVTRYDAVRDREL